MSRSSQELAQYERRMGMPLLVVSLLYLGLVFVEFLPDIHIGPGLMFVDGAFWAVFVVDWAYRVFWLAPDP